MGAAHFPIATPKDDTSHLWQFKPSKHWMLVVEPTHLKNMRQSNWIISPGIRGKHKTYSKPPGSIE